MRNLTETVKHLLIINVIFFVASLSLGDLVYDLFALHYPSNPKFQYWQPLTHMFMHGDFGHIFFNMFGLYMFGVPIEQMWGRNKFIFFYLSTGFGAAASVGGMPTKFAPGSMKPSTGAVPNGSGGTKLGS